MTLTSSPIANFLPWPHPRLLRSEADYEQALAAVEVLMHRDLTAEQSDLLDLLIALIEKYEDEHHPIPATPPHSMLEFLMEQRDVKQADLMGVIGSSGVVSEVVNGKREISKNQAKALGEFFGVDYHLFL